LVLKKALIWKQEEILRVVCVVNKTERGKMEDLPCLRDHLPTNLSSPVNFKYYVFVLFFHHVNHFLLHFTLFSFSFFSLSLLSLYKYNYIYKNKTSMYILTCWYCYSNKIWISLKIHDITIFNYWGRLLWVWCESSSCERMRGIEGALHESWYWTLDKKWNWWYISKKCRWDW